MNLKQEIEIAQEIAKEAHKNDFRKRSGLPYTTHTDAVADGVSDEAKPAGHTHDVMEDHPEYTPEILLARGLSKETVEAITLLDKNRCNGDYEDYIKQICKNKIAREVKIADIRHNLSDGPKAEKVAKYEKALGILLGS